MALVLIIWLISVFDYSFTVHVIGRGMAGESNPLAAMVLGMGRGALFCYKFVLVAVSTAVMVRFRHRASTEVVAWVAVAVLVVVALRWNEIVHICNFIESIRPPGYVDRDPLCAVLLH